MENLTTHAVEIYSPAVRISGTLTIPSLMRLSDYLNDKQQTLIVLGSAVLTSCSGEATFRGPGLPQVIVDKRNAIAVVERSSPKASDPSIRIPKVPESVVAYAPPFIFVGDVYRARQAALLKLLEGSREDFLCMTNVRAAWLETNALLGDGLEFAAIYRPSIIAVHHMESNPAPSA